MASTAEATEACARRHDDLGRRGFGAEPAQNLEAVDAGQPYVDDRDVRARLAGQVQPLLARASDHRREAVMLEVGAMAEPRMASSSTIRTSSAMAQAVAA